MQEFKEEILKELDPKKIIVSGIRVEWQQIGWNIWEWSQYSEIYNGFSKIDCETVAKGQSHHEGYF